MSKARAWVVALRLRTLPLALASTGMGNFLAAGFHVFSWRICILTSLTAVLLQILSNFANDYGDYKHGADNEERIGPQRGLQSGHISLSSMRNAIIACVVITLGSGCYLLYIATRELNNSVFILFFLLGILCIAAAIKYTVGKNPYGYSGFGDVAVFIFFGIIGVAGTFFLQAKQLNLLILLPAATLGFLSAGVLNVNNMRDINSDGEAGKRTIVVRMGLRNAKRYHLFLITTAFLCLVLFSFLNSNSPWQWVFLITSPLFIRHVASVMKQESSGMDKYLKQLAISTLLLVLCFGIAISCVHYV